jgi:hypothetical protein
MAREGMVVIHRDEAGEITRLTCPNCGKDDVREFDRAERWNTIEIVDGTLQVSQADADFETVCLVCADCTTELDAPSEVYEAMSWL